MSVPPQLIRVKRKATEEAPVSFLRVQENKRHRSDAFVYQRQEVLGHLEIPVKPIIHNSSRQSRRTVADNGSIADDTRAESTADADSVRSTGSTDLVSEPRRFHMSKRDMIRASSSHAGRSEGGVSRKRSTPTLFVERKIKQISSRPVEKFQALVKEVNDAMAPTVAVDMEIDKPEPRKQKKPGIAKYLKKEDNKGEDKDGEGKASEKHRAVLPKSLTDRWDVDLDTMTAEMNAFAMEQIGLKLRAADEENKSRSFAGAQLKFKPKSIKRYAERHPDEAQDPIPADREMADADADASDSDDGDYIIETYERVPASKIGEHVPAHKIGVLVLEADPELEYFYGDDGDSEEEWAEDEEDENAENYYTADYPDEEVASDDEFDKNPYSFRTGNASDLEEYDLANEGDDAAFSDEGEGGRFTTYIGRPNREFSTRNL